MEKHTVGGGWNSILAEDLEQLSFWKSSNWLACAYYDDSDMADHRGMSLEENTVPEKQTG